MLKTLLVLALAAAFSVGVAAWDGQGQQTPPPTRPPAKPVQTPKPPPKPTPAAKPATTAKAAEPAPAPPPPATDVKMKTAYTQGAQVSENTTYLQGTRQRVEFPGVVSLEQCDLKRSVMLNTTAKKYLVHPYAQAAAAPVATPDPNAALAQMGMAEPPPAKGGVITITTTIVDTMERQPMFGLEARHIKTTVVKELTGKTCDKTPLKVEVDAWYVDLPAQSVCLNDKPAAPPKPPPDPSSNCLDRIETKSIGTAKLGFPVKTTTTTTMGEGEKAESNTGSQEVTALEITRLEKSLFEVPGDFSEVKTGADLVPAIAAGGSLADTLLGSTADGTSVAAPKKAGTIRIGVLEPINRSTRTLPAGSLRLDLVDKFNKAPYQALALSGTSPSAIEQEAIRLQCDYLLLAEITEVKTSKPGKMSGISSMAGGGPPKDTHEVKIDYKLFATGATQAPKLTGNAKASSGGFSVGTALRIAAFAGQLYFGMMGGGLMGGMNPMMGGAPGGGMGGFFDPRASAMSSTAMGLSESSPMMAGGPAAGMPPGVGMGVDTSEAEMRQTVTEALANVAKSAIEQLKKK